nr:hypothetical protein [Paracoccus sp. JM45]
MRFKVADLRIQHGFQFGIEMLDVCGDALFLAGRYLCHQPLAHDDDLSASRRQGPENTQAITQKRSSGFRPEHYETGNELCIDPVRLGSCIPRHGKSLDPGRRKLPRFDPRLDKHGPQCPFLSVGCLKPDLKEPGHLTDHRNQLFMPFW